MLLFSDLHCQSLHQALADQTRTDNKKVETLNDYLKKNALVESVVKKHKAARPFSKISVLLIHHLTREVLGTIQAFRLLGCDHLAAQFLGYNPDAAKIFRPALLTAPDAELQIIKLKTDDNDKHTIDRGFTKPADFLPSDDIDGAIKDKNYLLCQRSLALFVALKMLAKCATLEEQKLVVVEDGGYIAPLLNDAALRRLTISDFRKENFVAKDSATDEILKKFSDMSKLVDQFLTGTVEHTRNGYDKVQRIFLKHGGKLARPHFTIALSHAKTQDESNYVAGTCINSLSNALGSYGRCLRPRRVCVLGSRGNIGGRAVKAFNHRLDTGVDQVYGVDLRVGFACSEERPEWEPSPYNQPLEGVMESRKFSDLPETDRQKVDVIFGVTGGRQLRDDDKSFDETLVADDIKFWLENGDTKYNELWLVSGSTKTREFELVKKFVEDLANGKEKYKDWQVTSETWKDPLSHRDYGEKFSFAPQKGKRAKTLFAVNDWKPANFMFYGVPTEGIDGILAQLVDVTVRLINKASIASAEVHAVDYAAIATDGIIDAVSDPLLKDIPVPNPPGTAAAEAKMTDIWTQGEIILPRKRKEASGVKRRRAS
jgi:hypothetical protein